MKKITAEDIFEEENQKVIRARSAELEAVLSTMDDALKAEQVRLDKTEDPLQNEFDF